MLHKRKGSAAKVSELEGKDTEGDICNAVTHINTSSLYFVCF
jgi:hypothetical protein